MDKKTLLNLLKINLPEKADYNCTHNELYKKMKHGEVMEIWTSENEEKTHLNVKSDMEKTTHEEHKKGGYFQKGCDECAMFIGHAVMKGTLELDYIPMLKEVAKKLNASDKLFHLGGDLDNIIAELEAT